MFLDIYSNNGLRYIRICESYSIKKNGVRVARKRQIKSIGPVSRSDDGKPDFEQRLKDSFKAGSPLIPVLLPYVKKDIPKEVYHLTIHSDTDECIGEPKLFAPCLFDKILDDIGLRSFVGTFKNYDKISYDVLGFLKLAVYGRILNPVSKIATVNQNDKYYSPILSGNFYEYNIYDMLDFVNKHKSAIFNRIDLNMRRSHNRTTNKIFYDVTNFFFDFDTLLIPQWLESVRRDINSPALYWACRRAVIQPENFCTLLHAAHRRGTGAKRTLLLQSKTQIFQRSHGKAAGCHGGQGSYRRVKKQIS